MPEKKEKRARGRAAATGKDQNLIGALCYIPFMWIGAIVSILILLTENKENKFLKFHATQAIMLYLVSMAAFAVLGVTAWVIAIVAAVFTYGLGAFCVVGAMLVLVIAWLVLILFCAWKALNGEEYEIPVLGKYARKYL